MLCNSITCKDLSATNVAYCAQNDQVKLDAMFPPATMIVSRNGNIVTVSGTNWASAMTFDLEHRNVSFVITEKGFSIQDISFGYCRKREILGIPEHKHEQLQELKKLLTDKRGKVTLFNKNEDSVMGIIRRGNLLTVTRTGEYPAKFNLADKNVGFDFMEYGFEIHDKMFERKIADVSSTKSLEDLKELLSD